MMGKKPILSLVILVSICLSMGCASKNNAKPATGTLTSTQALPSTVVSSVTQTAKRLYTGTATKTRTLTFTPSPTLTSTSLFTTTPEGSHTWQPSAILVRLQDWRPSPLQPAPRLVIFSNGIVVVSERDEERGFLPFGTMLERQEICAVLNTIDHFGFLEYDRHVYRDPMAEGPSETIEINAWTSNYVNGIMLGCWVTLNDPSLCCFPGADCETPIVMPALEDTYRFLTSYRPNGLQPLPINDILVVIDADSNFSAYEGWPDFEAWPIPELPLIDIYRRFNGNRFSPPLVLSGEDAQIWQKYMPRGIYKEGEFIAHVFSRPQWPYEVPTGSMEFMSDEQIAPEVTSLTCTFEDGLLKIGDDH